MAGRIGQEVFLGFGNGTFDGAWASHPQLARWYLLVGRDQRACGDYGTFADRGSVQNDRPDADHRAVADHASVEDRRVPDHDFPSDRHRADILRCMDDRTVLHIGAVADEDRHVITSYDGREPDAGARSDMDVADHRRGRRYKRARGDSRDHSVKRVNRSNLLNGSIRPLDRLCQGSDVAAHSSHSRLPSTAISWPVTCDASADASQ